MQACRGGLTEAVYRSELEHRKTKCLGLRILFILMGIRQPTEI